MSQALCKQVRRRRNRALLAGVSGALLAAATVLLPAVSAPAAPPVLALEASDATIGGSIRATANLSESPDAGGEIAFEVFGPGDPSCAGTAQVLAPTAVSGAGEYASADLTPAAPGEYSWSARYSGDGVNEPADAACAATSTVAKASPTLAGSAGSATVGGAIHDEAVLSGGFAPGGEVTFSVHGPGDPGCLAPLATGVVQLQSGAARSADHTTRLAGDFRWVASYSGDANNEAASTPCGAPGQTSVVAKASPALSGQATPAVTVGQPIAGTATLAGGLDPGGRLLFRAYGPGDAACTSAPAFSATVAVAGNRSYGSPAFVPARVGSYRWTVAYSGDADHAAATAGCGSASSAVLRAAPAIVGWTKKRIRIGESIRDSASLQGAHSPTGTITFRVYGPNAAGCARPLLANTVALAGHGPVRSDPLVPRRPGRYSFLATYSGDAANLPTAEGCETSLQSVLVIKRSPRVKPRARLTGKRQISILAHLSGAFSPAGRIEFRLHKPADRRCKRKPAFAGTTSVTRNGSHSLAEYLATRPGTYRLVVGYSGDLRNNRYRATCRQAERIRVGS